MSAEVQGIRRRGAKRSDKLTGVSYKWFPSVAGLPNLYCSDRWSDGYCKLNIENISYTENTFLYDTGYSI